VLKLQPTDDFAMCCKQQILPLLLNLRQSKRKFLEGKTASFGESEFCGAAIEVSLWKSRNPDAHR
jgi:hypothetical protein